MTLFYLTVHKKTRFTDDGPPCHDNSCAETVKHSENE